MKGSTTRHRGTVLAHKVSQLVTYKSEFLVVFVFRLRAENAVPVSFLTCLPLYVLVTIIICDFFT